MNNDCYLLVVNASNIKKDWDWISMHNTDDVEMENISDKTSLLAVQDQKLHYTSKPYRYEYF